MDSIIKGFLTSFSQQKNYTSLKESTQFEYFTLFCVINNENDNVTINEKQLSTGCNAQGIDGIGIIVNNKLCTSIKEIQDIIDMNGFLDVTFVLIQSKTSHKFEGSEISQFLDWCYIYFNEEIEHSSYTDEMKNFFEMKNFIYEHSGLMTHMNPVCRLYYCCTGTWVNDTNLMAQIETNRSLLDGLSLFSTIQFIPCDSKRLQELYRKTVRPVTVEIDFQRKINLPKISEIELAYFGILPFAEFRKIIIDDEGKIRNVFDDNIRDYLGGGGNLVNDEIAKTITNGNVKKFCILNNGGTIVSEKITGAGDSITLKNFQIVNGCQTSNVIYENRDNDNLNDMFIPVKIISTDNMDIRSEIARATNNQTAVRTIDLGALTLFKKQLQEYYDTRPKDENKLYFERRTNQYKGDPLVPLNRVITREIQIKSFFAMFLNMPHAVAGYYGKLVEEYAENIFNSEKHQVEYYYLCALGYFHIENILINLNVTPEVKIHSISRYKYYILMIFRMIVLNDYCLNINNPASMKKACAALLSVLASQDKRESIILESVNFLISLSHVLDFGDRKMPERKETTDKIISQYMMKYKNKSFITNKTVYVNKVPTQVTLFDE